MGNQGHASEGARLTNEWIGAGVIGEVREVHVWSDRAGRMWKQGIGRPTDTPATPRTLEWSLWLGPVPERPYLPVSAPVGGAAGGTSAPARWATWAATSLTTRCGP